MVLRAPFALAWQIPSVSLLTVACRQFQLLTMLLIQILLNFKQFLYLTNHPVKKYVPSKLCNGAPKLFLSSIFFLLTSNEITSPIT
jgi:hypothetical protein